MSITPIGEAVVVNTTAEARQPIISVHSGETVVVGWRHPGQIRGQRLSVTGEKVGAEFLVAGAPPGGAVPFPDVGRPAIDAVGFGSVCAVWLDSDRAELRGQLFDQGAAKVGDGILVGAPAGDASTQRTAVAGLQGAGFVVGWTGVADGAADRLAPRVQVFRPDGSKIGDSVVANTTTDGNNFGPQVAALLPPVGGFVVAWIHERATDDNALHGRVFTFDDDGRAVPASAELQLADSIDDPKIKGVALTGLTGGRFVAAWIHADPHSRDVRGRLFNPDGSAVDEREIAITPPGEGPCREPALEKLSGGGFAAAWSRDALGGDEQVRARVFAADGSALGGPILVGGQRDPVLTALDGDRFVIAWSDFDIISVRARAFRA